MPDKAFSVATYAAGASLATIALVYVFAPTYFLDSNSSASSNPLASLTSRKTGVVGLVNAANDCFINSVLQALAGLGDLRIYLIRETYRRKIDDAGVYVNAVPQDAVVSPADGAGSPRRPMPVWKIEGLQAGLVTKGLKNMIDQLNERPIYKKVITAGPFVRVLEVAFRQRISRQQQDAQEFLQVVAERLCDEYHAGQRARQFAKRRAALEASEAVAPLNSDAVDEKLASIAAAANDGAADHRQAQLQEQEGAPLEQAASGGSSKSAANGLGSQNGQTVEKSNGEDDGEDGFPMEGKIESQIECLTCGFKPRPSEQTFCTLTLNVPQASSTSLSACFDSMLKTEYIDEFKCEKCRLVHAKEMYEAELAKSPSEAYQNEARRAIAALQQAIDTDPERPPPGVVLPDVRYAPKRRIARHFRLVTFPKVLAIHLSRSIYDAANMSQKNSAKVSFPERLPLGGLLHQRKYKLISVVMHKGSHHSGHYESFRRQTVSPPYSNPNTFQPSNIYSPSSTPIATTPKIGTSDAAVATPATLNGGGSGSPASSTADLPPAASSSDASGATPPPTLETVHPLGPKAALGRASRSSSLRERSSSTALPPAPTSAPREPQEGTTNGKDSGNSSGADAAAETSSLRSITRSTWSRIAPSSRSSSRAGSRAGSQNGNGGGSQSERDLPLRPVSKDGAASNGTAVLNGSAVVSNGTTTDAKASEKKAAAAAADDAHRAARRKKKTQDRWWRISDEKVREASTREVLGMQREVYLLFYELERDPYQG